MGALTTNAGAQPMQVALTTNAGARTVSFGASDRLSAPALSAPSESGIGTALELTRPTGKEKSLEFEGSPSDRACVEG
jgi:hypothetical protein